MPDAAAGKPVHFMKTQKRIYVFFKNTLSDLDSDLHSHLWIPGPVSAGRQR